MFDIFFAAINSAFGLYAFHLFSTEGNTGAFYDVPQQGFLATNLASGTNGSSPGEKVFDFTAPSLFFRVEAIVLVAP